MRADLKTEPAATPLAELREKYPPGSEKQVFVIAESGDYLGTLDVAALHEDKSEEALRAARDFVRDPELFLLPYENVRTALARFEEKELETLPVLASPSERKVIGYLSEQYALRRYNQALERRRSAELGDRDLFSIAEPPR
jgi:CIC family chloride channel protein